MKKDENKKIYVTTGGNMGDDMIEKMFKELLDKQNTLMTRNNNLYSTIYDYNTLGNAISFLMDDIGEKKNKHSKISTLDELFERLDCEEIKTIRMWVSYSEIEITTEDKKERFVINIEGIKAAEVLTVIKAYLNKKNIYLIDTTTNSMTAVNLDKAELKGFNNIRMKERDPNTVTIQYYDDWFTVGKKKLALIFDKVPDVKLQWLRLVKNEIEKGQRIIDAAENHPVYQLTDEDRLIIEVLD